jgi:hypothetical protein
LGYCAYSRVSEPGTNVLEWRGGDGHQQVGFTERAEQERLVERFRLEEPSERVLSLGWRCATQRLVPLPGRLIGLEVVCVDATS